MESTPSAPHSADTTACDTLIKITVKTLDSRNHDFVGLPASMTIRDLKSRIAPAVGIEAVRQRLIYCGRVLQDDKKLSEYDVDGKVIHLVQRPPPSTNPRDGSGGARQGGDDNLAASEARAARARLAPGGHRGHVHHVRAFPAPGPLATVSMGQSSPSVRLSVAKDMLRRARALIDRIENPQAAQTPRADNTERRRVQSQSRSEEASPSAAATQSSATSSPTRAQLGRGSIQSASAGSVPDVRMMASSAAAPFPPDLAQAISGIVQNVIDGSVAHGQPGQQFEMQVQVQVDETPIGIVASPPPEPSHSAPGSERGSPTSTTAPSAAAEAPSASVRPPPGGGGAAPVLEYPPVAEMADVMDEYQALSQRLSRHWSRLTEVLRADPESRREEETRERQALFNQVTQVMHFMSHSQHALSDLMLNFDRPRPRVLRANPFIFPLPVQTTITATGPPVRFATASAAPLPSRTAQRPPVSAPTSSRASEASAAAAPTVSVSPTPPAASESAAQQQAGNHHLQQHLQQHLQHVQTALGSHVAASAAVTHSATPQQTSRAQNAGAPQVSVGPQGVGPIVVGIPIDVTMTQPGAGTSANERPAQQNFLESILRPALTGIAGGGSGSMSFEITTSSQGTAAAAPSTLPPGENSSSPTMQDTTARQSTQTHPTASTRTPRATPHIHYAAASFPPPPQMPAGSHFDPFLPCQSHHVAPPRARQPRRQILDLRPRSASVPPRNNGNPSSAASREAGQRPGGVGSAGGHEAAMRRMGLGSWVVNAAAPHAQFVSVGAPPTGQRQPAPPQPQAVLDPSLQGLLSQLRSSDSGSQDEANMINMVQGILGQVVGALGGGGPGLGGTVADFLNGLPDYHYTEGDSTLTDFLMTLARNMTFGDLIPLVLGQGDVRLNQLQQPLNQFVRRNILQTETVELSDEDIETAVTRFLDTVYPDFEEMSRIVNVREGIDFVETLSNFCSLRLVTLIKCVLRCQNSEFSSTMLPLVRQTFAELVATCLHCFTDERVSLERLFQNRLELLSGDALPSIQQWTMSSAMGHLRNYFATIEVPEDVVSGYVVRNADGRQHELPQQQTAAPGERRPAADPANGSGREKRSRRDDQSGGRGNVASPANQIGNEEEEEEEEGTETFGTPRSSPELMETENTAGPNDEATAAAPGSTRSPEETATVTAAAPPMRIPYAVDEAVLRFPRSLLPRSGMGPDMVVGGEAWHRALPSDWVPIVARDSHLQNNASAATAGGRGENAGGQAPLSDAYLSTQPAKRRKIAAEEKPDGDLDKLVSDTLQDALRSTGAQPTTASVASIVAEVSANERVREAVESEVMGAVRRRIERDQEYKTHVSRYPQSSAFLAKKK